MNKTLQLAAFFLASSGALSLANAQSGQLTVNGDFELGDTSSWQNFPSATSTFNVTFDANSGNFAGVIVNQDAAAAALVKQANLGIASVSPGDRIRVSFAAKGSAAVGGVAFAEFFSEVGAGGVSSAEILGGGPLPLTDQWQNFCFTTVAGNDVTGGVTLQLAAITGAATGSMSTFTFDDVSVTIEELGVNGGFELGDTSGWQSFPTPNSTFVAQADANSGSFGGQLTNPDGTSGAVIKQANLGVGVVSPGDTLKISFAAKGTFAVGGVAFAEFFSEIAGGGVSSAQFLSGGPLGLSGDWQDFEFTVTAGADVSGGVTLQFAAITGAATGSSAELFVDDVSITTTSGTTINYCTTTPNSVGPGAVMSSSGSPSVSAQDFVIEASGLPPGTFALFFPGLDTDNAPVFNGTRCVSDVCRIGPIFNASPAGTISRDLPDSVYTQFGCAPPMVGTQFHFQCVYRDSVGAGGNWSDGLCVIFGE